MKSEAQEAEKICRYCAENIPAAARLCPRCRQWLTLCSFHNPIVGFVIFSVPFLAMTGLVLYTASNLLNPRPYYSEFTGSIQILQSDMNWAETYDGTRLFLTGIVTNRSQVGWRNPEFECRFFNSKGKLVDASTSVSYLTLLPGADSAFRVAIRPALSSNEYNSFRISVSNARNSRSHF